MSLILSGSDGLSDVDGSAATPAIRGTDANTGIFFGSDIIGFSEGGVEAMRINASGVLVTTNDAAINGLTVGRGAGAVASNTTFGASALASNSTGTNNTAIGNSAMLATTGSNNVGVGDNVLRLNTTGATNVAVGNQALYSNTTASNNTAVGYQAGYTGSGVYFQYNTFVGYKAGFSSNPSSASSYGNTCIGGQVGQSLSTGYANCLVGGAGANGANPTGIGLTTGISNTFIGNGAGSEITTGSKNTIIGKFNGNESGLAITAASNYIVLSDGDGVWRMYFTNTGAPYLGAVPGGSNSNLQWNSGTGAVTYVVSSRKYKTNIQDTKYGLADVLKMRAVTFNYISDGTPDIGVIAEEMVDVVPEIVGLKDGQPDYVGYERLSSIFIKAIQELNAKIEAQALEIATLKGN